MNDTLKAVIVELSGGNIRNYHINLRGTLGLFPNDCLGGENAEAGGKPIEVWFGSERVETDIDETKAIFRSRAIIRQFFEKEDLAEGDLVMIARVAPRSFEVSKTSKRAFKHHL